MHTIVRQGWVLRFADGYTKRSNSVYPLYAGEKNLHAAIERCEREYERVHLAPTFKMTPFAPPELDRLLASKGYAVLEPSSVRVLNRLDAVREPVLTEMEIEERLGGKWLDLTASFKGMTGHDKAILRTLLENSLIRKGYFILHDRSVPVACGLAALDQDAAGLFEIVTAEAYRNRGYGEQLILHMLGWARANGAAVSYLQVVQSNAPACRLYDKLNFQEAYPYWYRQKRREEI